MVAGALADGFGHSNSRRSGRRQSFRSGRQQQRSFRRPSFRRGRQEELDAAAPIDGYGGAQDSYGAATEAPEVLPPPDYEYADDAAAGALDAYGAADDALGVYAADDAAADPNLAMLEKAVPGIPGEDYPIFSEVPESGFSCDGQVDGGKCLTFLKTVVHNQIVNQFIFTCCHNSAIREISLNPYVALRMINGNNI